MNASAAVVTHALGRSFGEKVALADLELRIDAGEIVGLLGPNGAGKSTTIKILTTLLPPSTGTATVAGFDVVTQSREVRRRVGYVPQLVSADGTLTAEENLWLSAQLHGMRGPAAKERVAHALAFMNLADVSRSLVRTFSGGMIRRLEIAQAMLHRPAVLFLDEPTVGLDPVARHAVWDRLRALAGGFASRNAGAGGEAPPSRPREIVRDLHTGILLTTHDMDEADALCDRIALLHAGRVVAAGTPTALKSAIGENATLEDVFVHHTGGTLEQGGSYRDVARARVTAKRLG